MLALIGPSAADQLAGDDSSDTSYRWRVTGIGKLIGLVTGPTTQTGYPRIVESNESGSITRTTVLVANADGDYPLDFPVGQLPYVELQLPPPATLAVATLAPGALEDVNTDKPVAFTWEGVTGTVPSGVTFSIFDNTTFTAPGGVGSQWVSAMSQGAHASPVTVFSLLQRIPDTFTAWLADAIRLQYAIDAFTSAAASYTLTLTVKNSAGATVGTASVTLAGDRSDTELQNDLKCDLSGSGIGAGDTIQLTLAIARTGGVEFDLYLGELRFNWS